ncbi:serine protease [Pseudomonas sp. QL9]|uniref:serine protease n=1 Tax=Pseudomonas sp. QL9 TaxID=3242725 RepID=UPI00352AAD00
MRLFRAITMGIMCSLLVGCNGTLRPVSSNELLPGYFKVSSGAPAFYLFQGSAVQWNQQYAVSAAHIPLLKNVVYRCSTGCDLVFIRHDAEGPVPDWRAPIPDEELKTVGLSPLLITVKGAGTNKALRVNLDRSGDNTAYGLNDAPVVIGMSGGPVYAADGAVIGMTIGIFLPHSPLPPSLQSSRSLSVYVPYDIIQREWRLFSERQAEAQRKYRGKTEEERT